MSKFKFVLNREGVRSLLKGPEMQTLILQKGNAVRNRCGEGYRHDVRVGQNRCNSMIWAETIRAKRSNRKHNTLLKAMR